MRILSPWKLILVGAAVIVAGLLLAISPAKPVLAQDDGTPQATYTGAAECAKCHEDLGRDHTSSRHALALQDVGDDDDKSKILADFSIGDAERTVKFPGEDAARPLTAADVEYAIGAGRYAQRYVYRVERGKYAVLPVEWNTIEKKWQPYRTGDAWVEKNDFIANCAGCHVTNLNVRRSRWGDEGVQCEACHGPGSEHADAAATLRGDPTPENLQIIRGSISLTPDAQVCGHCHSAGQDPETNQPFTLKYRPGGNLLDPATFVLAAPDSKDHWWVTGHGKQANMQFNEWVKDRHAKALDTLKASPDAKPECLTCHSVDEAFTARLIAAHAAGTRSGEAPPPAALDTAKFGVTCVSCHNPHRKPEEGAPPFNLIADSYTLCATCHKDTEATPGLHHPVWEMFEGKTVIENVPGVPSKHFEDANGPRCATCHMQRVPVESATRGSHFFQPVLPTANLEGLTDGCTSCHKDLSAAAMLEFVNDSRTKTETRLTAARAAVKTDSPAWVALALDFVEGDGSLGVHNPRYTFALLSAVEAQLGLAAKPSTGGASTRPVMNPAECAECHQNEHAQWADSPHANASLNQTFREEFARQKQPSYCMGCHASGYDGAAGKYVFEGVVCSNCHWSENNAEHPPAPILVATDSSTCGACHLGAHAPSYDEWLTSAHNEAGVDCIDCHTPHNNSLKLGDVNTTCGNCHTEAAVDTVHMGKDKDGEDMSCVDCHMQRVVDERGVFVLRTGHSMQLDPAVCATCHGNVHALGKMSGGIGDGHPAVGTPRPPASTTNAASDSSARVAELETQVEQLTATAQANWATGLAGGAVGVLVLALLVAIILRRGKVI
jgi:predicted CXXCH cytochrome family protein